MVSRNSIDTAEDGIDTQLSRKFGLRKGSLDEKLSAAGRLLPKGVAEDVHYLREARKRTAHPRRRGQVDRREVDKIVHRTEKRFSKLDPTAERLRARINWIGVLVINLILFGVLYTALLKWLGAI